MKTCSRCKIKKQPFEFNKHRTNRDGLQYQCKECRKTYYQANKNKIKARSYLYHQTHKDEAREYRQVNKEKRRIYGITYRKAHPKKIKGYYKKSRQKNKLSYLMGTAIWKSLRNEKGKRSWENLVDFTLKDLVKRLKSTLPKGYTWDDYINGSNLLHVDHIVPISAHNFKTHNDIDFK